jgi:hypothetical protein
MPVEADNLEQLYALMRAMDRFLVGPRRSARLRTIHAVKLLVRHGVMVSSAKLVTENLVDAHISERPG